jgi:DNA-binding response OmpR family regulator
LRSAVEGGIAPMKSRILVVARDAELRATLARWLISAGHAVEPAESARHAREVAANEAVALAIVAPDEFVELGDDPARDLGDPAGGVITIGPLPASSAIPGGTHVDTPLDQDNVLALVTNALQPSTLTATDRPELLRFDKYILDAAGRTVVDTSGRDLALTRAEFTLLLTLARDAGRVISRDALRQAVVGRDAGPDDRSVDMLVSRLRRKIESDAKEPRIIVTMPGEGYKFTPRPQPIAPTAPATMPASPAASTTSPDPATPAMQARQTFSLPLIGAIAVVLTIVVAIVVWYPGRAPQSAAPTGPARKFDGATIPFVDDATHKKLAEEYPTSANHKALAIWAQGWGVSYGAPDQATAMTRALEQCGRSAKNPRNCRIYAVDMDVIWPARFPPLPLPADLHTESLGEPFDVTEIPTINEQNRRFLITTYVKTGFHKAAAIAPGPEAFSTFARTSGPEAARLAVEKCSDAYATPCLLVSVDGKWTVRIPKSRRVVALFMLTTEPGLSDDERTRINEVYREKEWRALVRGGSGGWYPVANAPSEAAAIEAALAACAQHDSGCRVHAIGNFRVADQ